MPRIVRPARGPASRRSGTTEGHALDLEAARRQAVQLRDRAQDALRRSGLAGTATLAQLADMVVERES